MSILHSRCLEESFEEEEPFCRKYILSSFSTFDQYFYSNFAVDLTAVVEKLHFSCPVELFEDLFLGFMKFFIFFSLQAESFQTFGRKTFGRVVDTEFKTTSL